MTRLRIRSGKYKGRIVRALPRRVQRTSFGSACSCQWLWEIPPSEVVRWGRVLGRRLLPEPHYMCDCRVIALAQKPRRGMR